ncbi:MAG: sigma-70 family RNA polymerase sigma factor [Clostridia bacterium]|nr:sigma-70 family RNA polymerase sigma factor [Clostridia bacterium]
METVKGPDSKEERIEHMVLRYQLPLLRLCYAYLHDEELAKDAVQETMIKAYRNLDSFGEKASEKTWLSRIAINTCKDMRRAGWFRHVDRTITLDMIPEPMSSAEPEDETLTLEIMKLPTKLKEVALLCWFQGMTYSEAAETLGISLQAVGSRLNRARQKLRFVMEGSEGHDPA